VSALVYDDVFDQLDVRAGDTLFLHAAADRLGLNARQTMELVESLLGRIGNRGTLLVPSYTWRGPDDRPAQDSVLDVQRSPSAVGLLSEVFRRMSGTLRSEHYWVPVCGRGRLARSLLAGQAQVVQPFAPGATFFRLLEADAKVVGLGVSLNTSSLSHLPDYAFESAYPFPIFSLAPITGRIRRATGRVIETRTFIVPGEIMRNYKPSALFAASEKLSAAVRRADVGTTIRFAYPLRTYYEEGLRVGGRALHEGRLPPWLNAVQT